MGRFFAALLLCALLLTGSALMKGKAQSVFFSLLFEQLLPDWTQGEPRRMRRRRHAHGCEQKNGADYRGGAVCADAAVCACADGPGGGLLGASGETVRRVQQKLKQWGYYTAQWTACSARAPTTQ